MTQTMLRNVFFVLGLLSAVGALILADAYHGSLPAAGVACGFGISAGLCMIAAAIVAVGSGKPDSPPRTDRSERNDERRTPADR